MPTRLAQRRQGSRGAARRGGRTCPNSSNLVPSRIPGRQWTRSPEKGRLRPKVSWQDVRCGTTARDLLAPGSTTRRLSLPKQTGRTLSRPSEGSRRNVAPRCCQPRWPTRVRTLACHALSAGHLVAMGVQISIGWPTPPRARRPPPPGPLGCRPDPPRRPGARCRHVPRRADQSPRSGRAPPSAGAPC
jgi:hypothetical protein